MGVCLGFICICNSQTFEEKNTCASACQLSALIISKKKSVFFTIFFVLFLFLVRSFKLCMMVDPVDYYICIPVFLTSA